MTLFSYQLFSFLYEDKLQRNKSFFIDSSRRQKLEQVLIYSYIKCIEGRTQLVLSADIQIYRTINLPIWQPKQDWARYPFWCITNPSQWLLPEMLTGHYNISIYCMYLKYSGILYRVCPWMAMGYRVWRGYGLYLEIPIFQLGNLKIL
jgi:hypothetical protein